MARTPSDNRNLGGWTSPNVCWALEYRNPFRCIRNQLERPSSVTSAAFPSCRVRVGTPRAVPEPVLRSFHDPWTCHHRGTPDILEFKCLCNTRSGDDSECLSLPQSKSKPSNLFWRRNLIEFLTSWLLLSELATRGENLVEPSFQPVIKRTRRYEIS